MSENEHSQIMRALGNLEGKIDGINQRLDVVNGRLNSHAKSIEGLKLFQNTVQTRTGIIATILGTVASLLVSVFIKKL